MKTYITPVISLSLAVFLNVCAHAQTAPLQVSVDTSQVTLGGQPLTLANHQGHCALRKPDQTFLQLEMPWPCQFSPDRHSGKPRVEHFNNAEIIIVSHMDVDTAASGNCRSQYQAIRLLNDKLEPSIVAHAASCSTGPVDQKNFVGVFQW